MINLFEPLMYFTIGWIIGWIVAKIERILKLRGAGLYIKRLEQENEKLKKEVKQIGSSFIKKGDYARVLEQENKELKKTKGRCAFKSLDNTFCDEARIKIDKLELDRDCLNASLETARKYRGIAEVERDKYRSALEEIKELSNINKEWAVFMKPVDRLEKINKIVCEVLQ